VVVLYGVQQPGVSNESLTSCIDTVNALHSPYWLILGVRC